MDMVIVVLAHASAVLVLALLYTLLERKFEAIRIKGVYREVFWEHFAINIVFVAIVYGVFIALT